MENCCARTSDAAENQQDQPNKARRRKKRKHNKKERKPNPFADDLSLCGRSPNFRVLKDIMVGRSCIMDKYVLGRELGRGEFGITYLCMDRESKESLACKSISKKMLHTAIDVEDVRHEVAVLSNLLDHTNIVKLKATYEDAHGVHLVMELCEGGELFDRIVARGHYTKRTTAAVVCTVVEVVQMCHGHGVIHRDLKPDNFMFSFFFPLK